MQEVTTKKAFDTLLNSGSHFLLYKYNPEGCTLTIKTTPVVEQAIEKYTISAYQLNVLTAVELKYHIADNTGKEHASPQCLIFDNGICIAEAALMHISSEWFEQWVGK